MNCVNVGLQGEAAMTPEDVGKKAAFMLLEEISRGGVTDGTHQVHILLSLLYCDSQVSKPQQQWWSLGRQKHRT